MQNFGVNTGGEGVAYTPALTPYACQRWKNREDDKKPGMTSGAHALYLITPLPERLGETLGLYAALSRHRSLHTPLPAAPLTFAWRLHLTTRASSSHCLSGGFMACCGIHSADGGLPLRAPCNHAHLPHPPVTDLIAWEVWEGGRNYQEETPPPLLF